MVTSSTIFGSTTYSVVPGLDVPSQRLRDDVTGCFAHEDGFVDELRRRGGSGAVPTGRILADFWGPVVKKGLGVEEGIMMSEIPSQSA